jgi:hypothetical protein
MKTIALVFTFLLAISPIKAALADINNVNVDDSFTYNTRQTINVDIQVNTPTHKETGLTFYSEGVDGLRLLDTRVVAGDGHYVGKLTLPLYLKNIIVKSRWLDDFQEVDLTISGGKITTTFDHL